MKLEKHIENLVNLLKDIKKEPSPAVIGFAYSTAAIHIFNIDSMMNWTPAEL